MENDCYCNTYRRVQYNTDHISHSATNKSIYIYPFAGHWGNPIQNAIDLCTPRHQNPKLRSLKSVTEGLEISKFYLKSFKLDSTNAWRKRRAEKFRNTRIATFVFSIYRLGYGTFQEIFLENVETFFYFLQNFVRPADLFGGSPGILGPRGPRPPATGADRF